MSRLISKDFSLATKEYCKLRFRGLWAVLLLAFMAYVCFTGKLVDLCAWFYTMYTKCCSELVGEDYAPILGITIIIVGSVSFYYNVFSEEKEEKTEI